MIFRDVVGGHASEAKTSGVKWSCRGTASRTRGLHVPRQRCPDRLGLARLIVEDRWPVSAAAKVFLATVSERAGRHPSPQRDDRRLRTHEHAQVARVRGVDRRVAGPAERRRADERVQGMRVAVPASLPQQV